MPVVRERPHAPRRVPNPVQTWRLEGVYDCLVQREENPKALCINNAELGLDDGLRARASRTDHAALHLAALLSMLPERRPLLRCQRLTALLLRLRIG